MTAEQITRSSNAALESRRQQLHVQIEVSTNEQERDVDYAELDLITDELNERAHDLNDPSSGLGYFLPSGEREVSYDLPLP